MKVDTTLMTHDEFKRRFLPLQSLLFRDAMRILCDRFEAEDAVQNLYMRLWKKRVELQNLISPDGYCRMALRNICIDRLRGIVDSAGSVADDIQVPDETKTPFEIEDEQHCIQIYLSGLPPQQRKVVQLRMSGHNYEEIEALTGLSAVNVRVIITRLRKKFRKYYNK